jgi:hypothetical protein
VPVIELVVGLPGSGKSHHIKELEVIADKYGQKLWVIDDMKPGDLEKVPTDTTFLVISDVNFCDKRIRFKAMEVLSERWPTALVTCYYFENDACKARKNVVHRADGRYVEGTIARFEKTYKVPDGHVAHAIWQPE